jgi:hypothetical protein
MKVRDWAIERENFGGTTAYPIQEQIYYGNLLLLPPTFGKHLFFMMLQENETCLANCRL